MADLITLDEVKVYATISSSNNDTILGILIPKVSQLVKTYCGRTLVDYYTSIKEETFEDVYSKLLPIETPIRDVQSISYSTDFGQTFTDLVEFQDYYLDKQSDLIRFGRPINSKSPIVFKMNYRGGYIAVPGDLKLAVMDLVMYYFKTDMTIKSTRSPGSNSTQIEYVLNAVLPAHIRRVLDAYRVL